jgi:ubiquinone biosynthesis protein
LAAFAEQNGFRRFVPRLGRVPDPPLGRAVRLRAALGELGVTFIKLGQMLSTRADLIPIDYVTELAKLQDAAPPVPLEHIVRTITEELGGPPEHVFASFDPTPLASASIGQVHAAVLPTGESVVIKVRRPGVIEEVDRDLEIVSRLAQWVQEHTPLGRDIQWMPLVDEFSYTLRNELDYVREGRNAERFRQAFDGDPLVWIPRVYWSHTTERVLTLERVGGIKVSDIATLDRLAVPRREIAENAVRMFLREVLELGFFHADPHPGNFFVQANGSIAVVDFGMVGRVSTAGRTHLLRGGLAAIEQDPEALAEELFALGIAGRRADRTAFIHDLDHLIGGWQGRSIRELSATAVTRDLSAMAYRHRLQLPGELALLLRVVSMSEGLGLMVDPEFRYFEFAGPIVREQWQSGRSLRASVTRLGRAASDAAELGLELPRRAGRLLGRVERGEIELNVRHEGLDRLARDFQGMTNRLALAMVLAASVVALSVALGVHGLQGVEGYVRVLFGLGFVFSIAFGVWLLASIWRAGRR